MVDGERLERLALAGFRILPAGEILTHYVIERDGFVALVERRGDGFGSVGAPGLLQESAVAMLVWRGGVPVFVSKGKEEPARDEQVEALRRFDAELRQALA